jgi:excinuclease ABC subunit A
MPESLPPIRLRGVKQNNLKNIDVQFPQKKLTVITGLSGSGKSTLAFETLYAEGQRRYVESLSTYTRQFLEKMPKPDLESIENIPPAIALEQRNTVLNNRSTVGTQTEMLDYLRVLYSKAGTRICDRCHATVIDINPEALKRELLRLGVSKKFAILAPLSFSSDSKPKGATFLAQYFQVLSEQGFRRLYWKNQANSKNADSPFDSQWILLDEPPPASLKIDSLLKGELYLLMDRLNFEHVKEISELSKDDLTRFYDSTEQALRYGHEQLVFLDLSKPASDSSALRLYQTGFACLECGSSYTKPSPQLFSFQSPIGACPTCNGFGFTLNLDTKKIIPNPDLPLNEGAIDPLSKPSAQEEYRTFIRSLAKEGIRPTQSWNQLNATQRKKVWAWVEDHFKSLESYKYKFHVRILIRRYQSGVECTSCRGSRLNPEALKIVVRQKNISELLALPISDLLAWFESWKLTPDERALFKDLYPQIVKRLQFLSRVGVPYLTLNRLTRSLSGGEFQRINLATHLGNGLCGTLYVLDEPTIGLHPHDTEQLLDILRELRDQGNTVVVVEHETQVLKDADWIVEIGPDAGRNGGRVSAIGEPTTVAGLQCRTARFLGKSANATKRTHSLRPDADSWIQLTGCRENNLKNIDIKIPTRRLVVVTGVSGSGKTTLVHQTLAKAVEHQLAKGDLDLPEAKEGEDSESEDLSGIGLHDRAIGLEQFRSLILLDQKPIGKNSRSNPATYLKAWDEVRKLFSQQSMAMSRGYGPGHFSFNVDGGRCPTCKGEGEISVDMHFMAEIKLKCEDCEGKRFMKPVLDVKYRNRSISDVLEMTIDDAHDLFLEYPVLRKKLDVLREVGLGYLQLGQSGPTLSGGEAQRLKIAAALDADTESVGHDLFILDEPTTGLHPDDVAKLLEVLHRLVDRGKSVILIEHNLDVILNCDYVIDLGPEGGAKGGEIIAAGTPEQIRKIQKSKTGQAIRSA